MSLRPTETAVRRENSFWKRTEISVPKILFRGLFRDTEYIILTMVQIQ